MTSKREAILAAIETALAGTATEADLAELQGLLVASHLDGIYPLQPVSET